MESIKVDLTAKEFFLVRHLVTEALCATTAPMVGGAWTNEFKTRIRLNVADQVDLQKFYRKLFIKPVKTTAMTLADQQTMTG